MDIVLIGSGNTATVLGRKSIAAGHKVLQVYSPQDNHARLLAKRLESTSVSSISSIERNADLMLIAIKDDALPAFVNSLGEISSLVVHTAGALSIDELILTSNRFGVLYPLQSLRKEIETIPVLSVLVDGNQQKSKEVVKYFASTVAERVIEAGDDTRLKYHLAATMTNNFSNYIFSLTALFCERENIDFSVLQPLMEETVSRLRNTSPDAVQTGPAFRKDLVTLQKHRDILKNYPDILKLYELFTDEIQKSAISLGL
jgi:predicted short-subunit dehydrogenase-like oxidoreductase (DUF2520 family)